MKNISLQVTFNTGPQIFEDILRSEGSLIILIDGNITVKEIVVESH